MTTAPMRFGQPTRLSIPRGALWFGSLAALLINALRRLDRWQLGLPLQEPRTAEEVLAWASRIEANDPGFAADLCAAAMRSLDRSYH